MRSSLALRCSECENPAMRTLPQVLRDYGAYHRDARNIASHLIGVPVIVVAVAVLLSRPAFDAGALHLSAAWAAIVLLLAYYFVLDVALALLMTPLLALAAWFGAWCAALPTSQWLSIGVGAFVAGWAVQFVGHVFEGRKPAFLDDVASFIIAPLFVVVEVLCALGLRKDLHAALRARTP